MQIDYDDLKDAATRAKIKLYAKGAGPFGRRRKQRKPRDPEKARLLMETAIVNARKNVPSIGEDGRIVLPYFSL